MPKFCQKCGSLVEDSASFCGSCGAPMTAGYPEEPAATNAQNSPYPEQPVQPVQQPSYPQPTYAQPVQQPAYPQPQSYQPYPQNTIEPAPKKKKKTGLIVVISIVALLLIAAVVLIVVMPLAFHIDVFGLNLFGGAKASTPQDCVDNFIGCIADNDTDGMLDCIYETKYSELMRGVLKAQLDSNNGLGEEWNAIRSMGRDKVKDAIVITVSNETVLEDSEATELKTVLSMATVPTDKIEKIEKADIHVENKIKNESNDTQFYFVSAQGQWYILASGSSLSM